eukprot:gene6652-3202_t
MATLHDISAAMMEMGIMKFPTAWRDRAPPRSLCSRWATATTGPFNTLQQDKNVVFRMKKRILQATSAIRPVNGWSETGALLRGQELADNWAQRITDRHASVEINWEDLRALVHEHFPPCPPHDRMGGNLRDCLPPFCKFKEAALKQFNPLCANGPDLLTNLHLHIADDEDLLGIFRGLVDIVLGFEDQPESFLAAYIRLLFKKCDPLMLERWRALVMQSVASKWAEYLLQVPAQDQLEKWIGRFLAGIVLGFRKHLGTRPAQDSVHASADIARMDMRATVWQDADVLRAFP